MLSCMHVPPGVLWEEDHWEEEEEEEDPEEGEAFRGLLLSLIYLFLSHATHTLIKTCVCPS